jgi:predicted SprT family Zn-dependent metalloprotease
MSNIPSRIQTLINKAYLAIKEKRPEWYTTITTVQWGMNNRLRRTLGVAHMSELRSIYKIELSVAFTIASSDDAIYETIVHELSHIIAYRLFKDRGHGTYWRSVYVILGGNGRRTTSENETGYKVIRNRIKRIILEKNGKEYKITANRYTRCPEAYSRMGYVYRRTVIFNPDGTETLIHSHKEDNTLCDMLNVAQVAS